MDTAMDVLQSPSFWGGLFLVSEALASIPALKANSVFQLLRGVLESLSRKKDA